MTTSKSPIISRPAWTSTSIQANLFLGTSVGRSVDLVTGHIQWASQGLIVPAKWTFEISQDLSISAEHPLRREELHRLSHLVASAIGTDTKALLADWTRQIQQRFDDGVYVCRQDGEIVAVNPWTRIKPKLGPINAERTTKQLSKDLKMISFPLTHEKYPFADLLYQVELIPEVGLPKLDKLTPAQREVLTLILGGHTEEEMALARGVSETTIKKQKKCVLDTLGFESSRRLIATYAAHYRYRSISGGDNGV